MILSIVVPTLNRDKELVCMLQSAYQLIGNDVEIIVVDQNPKGFLDRCIPKKLSKKISIIHIDQKGGSNARNVGLSLAKGQYINFCDDDAIIEPNLLNLIKDAFDKYSDAKMISFKSLDTESDALCWLPFPDDNCKITKSNFRSLTNEFSQVWLTSYLRKIGGYDINLGPGSYFAAEEGNDLIVRTFSDHQPMYYISSTAFRHPLKLHSSGKRYFSYAAGTAALTFKHWNKSYVIKHTIIFILKGMAGTIIFSFWDFSKSKKHFMRCLGFFCGLSKSLKNKIYER